MKKYEFTGETKEVQILPYDISQRLWEVILICHTNPGHSSFVKPKGLEGRMI